MHHPFVHSNSHPDSSSSAGNPAGRAGKPCLHPGVPLSQALGLVNHGELIKAGEAQYLGSAVGGGWGRGGQRAHSPRLAPWPVQRRLAEGSLPAQGLPQTLPRRSGTCRKATMSVTSPACGGTCCNNRRSLAARRRAARALRPRQNPRYLGTAEKRRLQPPWERRKPDPGARRAPADGRPGQGPRQERKEEMGRVVPGKLRGMALRRGPGHRGRGVLGPAGQAEPRPLARKGRADGWLLCPHHPRTPRGGQRAFTHGGPGGHRGHRARSWGDLWEWGWPSVGRGLLSRHAPGCAGQPASHQGDFYPFLPKLRKDPQLGLWPPGTGSMSPTSLQDPGDRPSLAELPRTNLPGAAAATAALGRELKVSVLHPHTETCQHESSVNRKSSKAEAGSRDRTKPWLPAAPHPTDLPPKPLRRFHLGRVPSVQQLQRSHFGKVKLFHFQDLTAEHRPVNTTCK